MSSTVREDIMTDTSNPLPGFAPRDEWVRTKFGKGSRTAARWQSRGLLSVIYFGRVPYIDIETTLNRARRNEGRPGATRAATTRAAKKGSSRARGSNPASCSEA